MFHLSRLRQEQSTRGTSLGLVIKPSPLQWWSKRGRGQAGECMGPNEEERKKNPQINATVRYFPIAPGMSSLPTFSSRLVPGRLTHKDFTSTALLSSVFFWGLVHRRQQETREQDLFPQLPPCKGTIEGVPFARPQLLPGSPLHTAGFLYLLSLPLPGWCWTPVTALALTNYLHPAHSL